MNCPLLHMTFSMFSGIPIKIDSDRVVKNHQNHVECSHSFEKESCHHHLVHVVQHFISKIIQNRFPKCSGPALSVIEHPRKHRKHIGKIFENESVS